MSDLERAKACLNGGNDTCVLCKGEAICRSDLRGVKPLVSWYENKTDFRGYSAADKVVGKATAFLYLLHGVSAVYAAVISHPALALLQSNGIKVTYDKAVDHIINRRGDGICPFEEAVMDVTDVKAAYRNILDKMAEMQISVS